MAAKSDRGRKRGEKGGISGEWNDRRREEGRERTHRKIGIPIHGKKSGKGKKKRKKDNDPKWKRRGEERRRERERERMEAETLSRD